MRRGAALALGAVALAAVSVGWTATRAEDPVTVYAASSLTSVFPRVSPAARFQFAG
jgi:ABC-type molybdate transport system substrate-binding protein